MLSTLGALVTQNVRLSSQDETFLSMIHIASPGSYTHTCIQPISWAYVSRDPCIILGYTAVLTRLSSFNEMECIDRLASKYSQLQDIFATGVYVPCYRTRVIIKE